MYLAKTMKAKPEDDPVVKVRPSDDRFIFSGTTRVKGRFQFGVIWIAFCTVKSSSLGCSHR